MKAFLIVSGLALTALGSAQISVSKNSGYPNKIGMPRKGLSAQDTAFIGDAAAGNQFEIQSSQVALTNGSSDFVKRFAQQMIADHKPAFEELVVAATKVGMRASSLLPAKQAAMVKKLKGLTGDAFDKAYLEMQRAAHVETAAKLEREIKLGREAEIKDYAVKTLPVVRMHQKMLWNKSTM